MSRFNTKTPKTKVHNLAGGRAYKESTKLELASLLVTSFVQDQFYRKASDSIERVKELMGGLKDKTFAAKAAIYARTKFNMRSISHVVAGEVFRDGSVSGEKWPKRFIDKVVVRPDDATEILSYFEDEVMETTIPNQLKKGLGLALQKFNKYELAKYRGENKDIKMVDLVNISHPAHTPAIQQLVEGTLRSTKTWEAKLTKAGQEAETEEERVELKKDAWRDLILEGKLPIFALLRNLRNITEQADDETFAKALEQLQDPNRIKHSKILPFRFLTAADEIMKLNGSRPRLVLTAIDHAVDIACENVPTSTERTVVVLDKSGSMDGRPLHIGSLFAAILAKANNADVMFFADSALYVQYDPRASVTKLAQSFRNHSFSGGTNFHAIFQTLNQKYDRIIILSDMQGWMGYNTPTQSFATYRQKYAASPTVFSFDLQGYGTLQFPEQNVICLAGFSEKAFELMDKLAIDKDALVKEIEAIEI